mmetsp:Transcript_10174/g.24705  ORF Transcript_10174/g.24705 Transcript_10174/m.24705 type:complete len:290 (-) Transcript_10174:125-994(-)
MRFCLLRWARVIFSGFLLTTTISLSSLSLSESSSSSVSLSPSSRARVSADIPWLADCLASFSAFSLFVSILRASTMAILCSLRSGLKDCPGLGKSTVTGSLSFLRAACGGRARAVPILTCREGTIPWGPEDTAIGADFLGATVELPSLSSSAHKSWVGRFCFSLMNFGARLEVMLVFLARVRNFSAEWVSTSFWICSCSLADTDCSLFFFSFFAICFLDSTTAVVSKTKSSSSAFSMTALSSTRTACFSTISRSASVPRFFERSLAPFTLFPMVNYVFVEATTAVLSIE